MNRDSVNEYISWLEEFRKIYKDYIDSNEKLRDIFAETLEKFKKVLRENSQNLTEEGIIKLLKNLVKEFSAVYDANGSIKKNLVGPRKIDAFKQNIYEIEIAELKKFLIANINNPELFKDFESIVMFVAKKRQMIEFLKLSNFELFGKRRTRKIDLITPLNHSHAEHLYKELLNKEIYENFITYTYNGKEIHLTFYHQNGSNPEWYHTNAKFHPALFNIMNELYSKFLSNSNKSSQKDILLELYWLYMQTCPFERGSAAIGEILFSVLLRKYFGCDFLISNGWNGDPLTIPDIHALHYKLDKFKSIFWGQLTNCVLKKNSNNNNRNYLRENKYFYYL
jgi:hypothetical protein